MLYKTLSAMSVAFFVVLLSGCSFFSSKKASDVIVVGTSSGFPPYEVVGSNGELEGFDIDVAYQLGEKLGKKVVFKDLSFDVLIMSLKQNKIDAIIAGVSITPSRQQEIALVHYQGDGITTFPLVFWGKVPDGVTTIADLSKLGTSTVCVQAGNIQEGFVAGYDFITVKHLEQISQLIMEIKYGKALACVLEPKVIDALQLHYPELNVLNVPLGKDQKNFGHGIGLNKNNTNLIKQIDAAVAELKEQGVIAQLEKKWFGGQSNDN